MERRHLLRTAAAMPLAALARPALAQSAQALREQTLRFVPQADLSSLDPIWTTATIVGNHGYYVYDTLYSADDKLRPQPQMAAGHEVSENGLTWRIRLRDGLLFHDGTPVLARDCVASIRRWAVREPVGQLLAAVVDQWLTPDDRTVELRLSRRFPLMLEALAKPDASIPFIMPERIASADATKAITEVMGSGPYRFLKEEFVAGSRVAYARFDGYVPRAEPALWGTGGKVAHFPRVEWHIIPDSATAAAALQRGEVDWWERPQNDLLPVLEQNRNVQTLIQDPSGRMAVLRMNELQPPFDDRRVRRAVLLSVDQDEYLRAAYGDDTALWKVSRSIYPGGTPYAVDSPARMPGDLDAARRALKESGYAGQKVVILNPTDYPTIQPLGQVTADRLRRIGMNVDLQETDWGTIVQRRTSREPTDKGGWSIFHTTVSAPGYSSPASSPLIRGQGARGWFGWYDSPRVEQMVQAWLETQDDEARTRMAREIGDIAADDVATIPLGMFYVRTAFRRNLAGMLPGAAPYPWGLHRV